MSACARSLAVDGDDMGTLGVVCKQAFRVVWRVARGVEFWVVAWELSKGGRHTDGLWKMRVILQCM